jgi:hypothetical protein
VSEAGHKTALELALDAYREAEAERRAAAGREGQLALFDDDEAGEPAALGEGRAAEPGERRMGRPPGARNKRTDELARWYIGKNGGRDPLERGIEISGLPILAPGILEGLAQRLGCSRFDAAKFWAGVLTATLPYTHQRLAQLEVKPAGALGSGEAVLWTLGARGELLDARRHELGDAALKDVTPPFPAAEPDDDPSR